MNPRLLALLSLVGATAGGIAIYTVVAGTTVPQLADAGLGACVQVDVQCPARLSDAALDLLEDAGRAAPTRYRTLVIGGRYCGPDAGLVLPPPKPGYEYFRPDLCRRAQDAGQAEGAVQVAPPECACRGDGGICRVLLDDGGIGNAPFGQTLGPGYRWSQFNGAGCVAKSCGELLGETSWPPECPQ